MSARVVRVETALVRLLRGLVGALMLGAVAVNLANIVGRYVFLRPFVWAEEVMQFLNVWAVMLGAAIVTQEATHLRMDALHSVASRPVRRGLDLLADAVALAAVGYVIVQSAGMVGMLTRTAQKSVIAGVPMNLMYTSVFVGFACSALFLLVRLVRAGRGAA